jgi:choline dehydrogenase-like flavoprotein
MNCSVETHHFSVLFRDRNYYDPGRHGFIMESALSLPWGFANLTPGTGSEHLEVMRAFNNFGGMEVITKSDSYGEITPEQVKFDISEADNERLLFSSWMMSRLFFRVGAKKVYTGLPGLVLDSPSQLDEIYKYKRGKKKGFMLKQANLYSGHIFGGCVMGVDPKTSFADETGECHAIKGLWVGDGSAFPTNTGVNCLMSITLAARKIAQDFITRNTWG